MLQLEAAQGGEDEEAAAALAELKESMAALAQAEALAGTDRAAVNDVPDEVQLASVLDRSVPTHSLPLLLPLDPSRPCRCCLATSSAIRTPHPAFPILTVLGISANFEH